MTTVITAEQIEAAARKFARLEPGTAWEDVDVWGICTTEEWAERCRARVREILAAANIVCADASEPCPDHVPTQHRDGKPPWCPNCKLTALWQQPISSLDEKGRRPLGSEL